MVKFSVHCDFNMLDVLHWSKPSKVINNQKKKKKSLTFWQATLNTQILTVMEHNGARAFFIASFFMFASERCYYFSIQKATQ